LEELKSDYIDALAWANRTNNSMHIASVHTLPSLLLSFKLYGRLELLSGKGKAQLLSQGLSPRRFRRWGLTLQELNAASTGFSLQDLVEGGFSPHEVQQGSPAANREPIQRSRDRQHRAINDTCGTKELSSDSPLILSKNRAVVHQTDEEEGDDDEPVLFEVSQESCTPTAALPIVATPTVTTKPTSSTGVRRAPTRVGRAPTRVRRAPTRVGRAPTLVRRGSVQTSRGPNCTQRKTLSALEVRWKKRKDNFTAAEAREAGCTVRVLLDAGYSPREIHLGGYSVREMEAGKLSKGSIAFAGKTAKEMYEERRSVRDLRQDGYSVQELFDAGYTYEQLEPHSTAKELRSIGRSLKDLKKYYQSNQRLLAAGFTIEEIRRGKEEEEEWEEEEETGENHQPEEEEKE
jgi:hypothetical protein